MVVVSKKGGVRRAGGEMRLFRRSARGRPIVMSLVNRNQDNHEHAPQLATAWQ